MEQAAVLSVGAARIADVNRNHVLSCLAAAPAPDHAEPYRILQQANLALDPALATSAYASNAKLIFEYPGRPVETFQGRDAIRGSYVRTFGQVDPGQPIRIQFRFASPGLTSDRQDGAYRIDTQAGGRSCSGRTDACNSQSGQGCHRDTRMAHRFGEQLDAIG